MTTYNMTVTKQQLEFIRDATELLSRISAGQVDEVLKYAPIDPESYWEARGALLRALKPFEDTTFRRSIINNGCWDIYQAARYMLAWDRVPEGIPFCADFHEPIQYGSEPLPSVKQVESNQWIKCSDRLPGHGQEVLACNAGRPVETVVLYADADKTDGYYWAVFSETIYSADFGDFEYWMPLPLPPETKP